MTPRALQDRKTAKPECREYLEMFYDLSPSRCYSEAGQQPLQVSEIVAYLTEYGVSGGERRFRFLKMLRQLDQTYMTYHFKKQSTKDNAK